MKVDSRTLLSSGLLALVGSASAQVASVCPSTNVCFKLNIPENTASSGSGDVFFQISAPSTYQWIGLGQGQQMSGSNMFIVYTNSAGSNVTLSPRTASGHNMPTSNNNAQVTLLEGSGVSNGIMTANVKCSNCDSWSGGSMDFKASSGNFIYAYQSLGGAKNSDSQSVSITEHNEHDQFSWSFANAKGGSSVNPLVNAAPAASGTGGTATATSCIQRNAASASASTGASGSGTASAATPTQSSDDDNDDDNYRSRYASWATARPTARPAIKRADLPYCDEINSGNGNSNSGITPISSGRVDTAKMQLAHGALASVAFVALFPMGAIAVRLASFPGIVWIHAAFQVFAYLVYIAGFGLGVYIAVEGDYLSENHPIIGIVVFVVLFFMPILGFLHHLLFKKHQSRTLWSYVHIWLGRAAVTLGIINGGLGLKLAGAENSSKIAYASAKTQIANMGESRQELVAWLNNLLQLNITKVEQCGTGAALCQVFDSIFYDVPMSRVKFNANTEYAYLQNFKILQNTFAKHQIDKPIRVESLVKCKMQDNLEFLQFVKQYWDQHFPGHEYDPVSRRKGQGGLPATGSAPRAAPAAARRAPVASNTAAPRTRTPLAAGGGAASAALRQENDQLKETVSGLERERDFYFSKLRDIELLIQQAMEADPELEKDEGLLKQIQNILYSTEEGFEIPPEAEGVEEETF
ncbi:hypothetical protein EK21DRAFT_110087 [Setomelanomma holmii]|uniref:Uncharacterized protein n=1 Tax=Setomelanomma holmii TaxID=210430 RepID=A0A9P4LPP3_9PLEO|nr:hypothetical protein EK21DRAFT_110087 [Setomelanomma holmii]